MADRRVFLAGLAAGAMGGLLVGRLKAQQGQPRRMPYLDAGQQVLAEARGPVQAALLAARVQARYDDLYAHRLRFAQPALRQHYEEGILPSLALYQTLRETGEEQEAALAEMDRIIAAQLEQSGRRRLVQILGRMPDPFAALRFLNRWALKYRYPPEGWRFEWVEDSDQCIAYDARECFYWNVLTACGAPELTAHLCAIDDLLYGDLRGISWERTKTLGRGDDRCDFRFRRADASPASAATASHTLALYVCPACKGRLEAAENTLRCAACQVAYPSGGRHTRLPARRSRTVTWPGQPRAAGIACAPLRDAALVCADPQAGRRQGRAELRRGHPADGGLDGRPPGAAARRRLRAGDVGPAARLAGDGSLRHRHQLVNAAAGRAHGRQRQAQ